MSFFPRKRLVLLPGTGCNALLWRKVLQLLPKSIEPVMPNLLACTSQQEMLQTINKLPDEKFMLLGFSMGGYLAQKFYANQPERVSHLILLCTSGEKKIMSTAMIKQNLQRVKNEAYLSHMINPSSAAQKQDLYNTLITMLDQVGPEALERQLYAMAERRSVLDQLPVKPIPTLIIGARQDKLVPETHIHNLVKCLKADVKWVNSGHMLPLEAPEEMCGIITTWLINNLQIPESDSSPLFRP